MFVVVVVEAREGEVRWTYAEETGELAGLDFTAGPLMAD